jgi:hypothetical protein
MANPMPDYDPNVVELIETEFTRLPRDEQIRLTQEWLASLKGDEPLHLGAPICELVREYEDEQL